MIALGFPVMGELCRFPGDYFTFNNGQQFLLGTSQIVSALQVKPRIRVAAKVTRQPQSCVRRNRTPLIYYRVQTGGWNMQGKCQGVDAHAQWQQKIFPQDFARVDWAHFVFNHGDVLLLVVINYFDIKDIIVLPAEANPSLVVDADAILSFAVTSKHFQTVTGRASQKR